MSDKERVLAMKMWKALLVFSIVPAFLAVVCLLQTGQETRLIADGKLKIVHPSASPFGDRGAWVRFDVKTISGFERGEIWPVWFLEKDGSVMKEKTIVGQSGVKLTFTLPANDSEALFFWRYFPKPPILV